MASLLDRSFVAGAHTLSGAVIETHALDELIPDWRDKGAPITQQAGKDVFAFLTEKRSFTFPIGPPQMNNHGNYIVRLGHVVKWLGEQAEAAGVEVYPGIAAARVLYDDKGAVAGVATHDVGIGKDGKKRDSFEPGMHLRARVTIFGEGCRGHLTRGLEAKFKLRAACEHQTYGIGLKELWEVDPSKHQPGLIQHTVGWPIKADTYGGSFLYHLVDNGQPLVSIGYVVALDYTNPYMNPYRTFQQFKHHPMVASVLEGGTCLQYGARAISEGGYQSIPQLSFPGGLLVGDCAGTLNLPKIKASGLACVSLVKQPHRSSQGTHTAMKSGMIAAESAFDALNTAAAATDAAQPILVDSYPKRFHDSWVAKELYKCRNIRPSFHWGLYGALAYSALDTFVFMGRAPWTLKHGKPDHKALKPAAECEPIVYPKPDGKLSFDLLTNLQRSNTNHEEDQPIHLTLKDDTVPVNVNLAKYAGPESRYCPAAVYEFVENEGALCFSLGRFLSGL